MAEPVRVLYVRPRLTSKYLGISVGDACFSDDQMIRFHVLSKNPPAVRLLSDRPLPEHEKALIAWLAAQRTPVPA